MALLQVHNGWERQAEAEDCECVGNDDASLMLMLMVQITVGGTRASLHEETALAHIAS